MKRIHFTDEQIKAIVAYVAELARQDAKGSKGSIGKLTDVAYRAAVNVKGIKVSDIKCRRPGMIDSWTRRFGAVEVKTGAGVVAYGTTVAELLNHPDRIFRGMNLAWAPDTYALKTAYAALDGTTESFIAFIETAMNSLYIMDHPTALSLLQAMYKKGLQSALKQARLDVNIQTVSAAPMARFYQFVDEWQIPTVADLLSD